MSNEYLDRLNAQTAQPAAANPYLDLLNEQERRRKTALAAQVGQALSVNPEQFNQNRKVAEFLGYPLAAVEALPEDSKRQAGVRKIQQDTASSPTLQRKYTEADFAKLAHDDSGPLSSIAGFLKDSGNSVVAGLFNASKGAAGTFRAASELVGAPLQFLADQRVLPVNPMAPISNAFARMGEAAGATAKSFTPQTEGNIASGVQSGIQSLTQNLLTLPMIFLPGGQGAALTAMTASAGGQAYQDAREKLPMSQALPYAVSQAAIEYATERLPLSRLVGDIKAGTPFFRTLARQVALEIPGEQVATVLQDLNEWAILNPEKPFSSYLEERPSAAAQTLVATIVGVGGNVTVVKGIEKALDAAGRNFRDIQSIEGDHARMVEMLRIATESKLRERDGKTFAEVVQSMAAETNGAPTSIYIDGEVLAQSVQSMPEVDLATMLPSVAAQIQEAAATGGVVEVPIGEALAAIPGTGLEQVFLQNFRTSPEGMSLAEAQQASERAGDFLKQEADRVIAQAADQEALRVSQEAVKTNIKQQLAATGRFRDAVNEGYATWAAAFYTAYGSRLGMTPEQFYQRYPLRVLGAPVGQQTGVLNAAEQTTTPEFRAWFGNSQMVENGRPIVLYHGTSDDVAQFDLNSPNRKDAGYLGTGVYLSDSVDMADLYATQKRRTGGAAPNIMPLYARLENPYIATDEDRARVRAGGREAADAFTAELQAQGYDGVIYQAAPDGREIVVFDPAAVKSVFNRAPTDAPGLLEQAALATETEQDRTNSLGAARISPRLPTAKKATEDALGDTRLQPDLETAMRDPAIFAHNIGLMVQYPNFQGLQGTTEEQAEAIIKSSVDNLLWLHDHWKPEYRERSKLWYVGGNRIAHRWAERFGVTPEQVAAVVAATSPQKDWFQNVSLAERILEAVINNSTTPWDAKMSELVRTRDWGPKAVPDVAVYEGKTLRDLYRDGSPEALLDMAIWIRAWDEANNPMKARVITPEGGFTDKFDAGKSGKEIGLRWQSFPTIVKTLQVLMNNDREALSQIIGANHKVRSFYNNIIAPYAGDDVTIDTHAVAAALLRPLGSSSTEVFHNFGSGEPGSPGPKNSAITGLYGTYAIYAEAYRRAAKERGILPREMQSITWEAVRGLFRPEQKNERIRAESDRIWSAVAAGELDANDARQQIEKLVGGIQDPAWVRSPAGTNEAPADSSYAGELPRPGGAQGAADGRGGMDAAGGVEPGSETLQQAVLEQGPRGTFNPATLELVLNPNADLSTWFHETGHFFLEVLADVASQPDAPAQITEDYNKVLAWFGVTPEQWAGYSLDEKRPYHERWAESIEQYVMEGKAPSVELQGVMRRFRAWMLSVYQSLQKFIAGKPELQLNDDIRRVMDRMLATDEQIAQANEVAGLVPDVDADGEAAERLQKRSMADLKWTVRARDKIIKQLQKQAETIRKGIRAEVQAEVEQEPIYRAMRWLKKGETTDPETGELVKAEKGFRLNTEALAEMYPESALDRPDLAGLRGMTSKDGLPPDVVADMFGFASGDQLVRSLLTAEPMADVVDAMTEQRMLEENGDLVDKRAIQEAANEAVHNEARARSLATELRTQQEMLGQRTDTGQTNARGARVTVNALVEAAKQFGANVVARTPLRDLKATAWKHTAAERRAGKRWQEATSAGKTDEAVQAKRDQVLNNAAARASIEAQAEAKKILEFFKRVTKGNDEKTVEKGRDPDIVNAARAVLAAYGVETPTTKNAVDYMERVQQNDPATYAAIEPMMTAALANAQPLEALTVEQLQGLNESIQAMWFLAKRSRQMEVDGDLLDIDDLAGELNARMEEVGIPDTIPGEASAITAAEERAQKLQFVGALLRRVEQWAEAFDGKFGGPFLRFVFQPVKDAADRYRADRVEYRKKFQALIDGVAPFMPKGEIAAPELGYTFGKGHNGIGMAELLHAILHTGNGSNKRKLLLGRGWATENADGTLDTSRWDNFLARLANEGKLQKQHYDFAQGVWDLMEQTKPLAQKTHRDVFGRYFAEVTAEPFVDPFGQTRAGGYVPAQADARIVRDAELRQLLEGENESMAYAFPQTNRGFTKSRTEYNRPLILDLRTLPQHLDKVLLFSHMEPAVRGVRRLLARPAVSQPLGRIQPAAMTGMLIPWLNRSARQIVETPIIGDGRIARAASALRNRAGMALMFGNLSNTIQQITGLSGAAVKVKPSHLLRASSALIRDRKAMLDAVWAASPYMADRANNEIAAMNQAMEQILLDASLYERAQDWTQKHAYFLQTAVDNVLSPVVWTGAYNQAIEEGMDERMAVRFADGVVRQTQGSTLPEDVSRIETGPAYARVFTQFIGYFNMMANTNGTALKQIAQDIGLKKGAGKAAYVVLAGFLLPIWIAEAIAIAFRGGPEDEDGDGYLDDWLAAVLGMGTIKGMFAQIPFVGQLANAGLNRLNNNPADDRVSLSPAVSLLEGAVGSPVSVYQAIVEDGNKQKAVRDVAALVSMATGLPASFAARSGGYLAGVASGDIQPTGPVDFARGVLTGVASPESR